MHQLTQGEKSKLIIMIILLRIVVYIESIIEIKVFHIYHSDMYIKTYEVEL